MKLFRSITILLMICLGVSALLHVILLSSDSSEYRTWVYVQISLQVLAVWLLWQAQKFRLPALLGCAVLSVPFVYINAKYVNPGNGPALWVAPVLFWFTYGGFAVWVLSKIRSQKAQQAHARDVRNARA